MTQTATDGFKFGPVTATQGPFTLAGGLYGVLVEADFSGAGTVTLQAIAGSGTAVTCLTAISADGYATVYLPAGRYQFTVGGTIAAGYMSIFRIPL
jgi:hypothetical protein